MSKYMFKERLIKIIEMIDCASNELETENPQDCNPYSLFARAISFSVYQVCEHIIQLEKDLIELRANLPFQSIHKTRVFIAHIYDKVDTKIIYDIVRTDFPPIKETLTKLVSEL